MIAPFEIGTLSAARFAKFNHIHEKGLIEMRKQKGFSWIELLIVVAIILIIAAIAIPNLLRARMAANESSAVASVRTINSAEVTYNSTYPTIGFSANLKNLGGAIGTPCVPGPTSACLIDAVLTNNGDPANSGKSAYKFSTGAGTQAGTVYVGYTVLAAPLTVNQAGIRAFCSEEDAVVRVDRPALAPTRKRASRPSARAISKAATSVAVHEKEQLGSTCCSCSFLGQKEIVRCAGAAR